MKYNLEELKNSTLFQELNINKNLFIESFNNKINLPNKNEEIILSFIIPSFNRYEMLKQTLKSIFIQNFTNYEVIIINDNSSQEEYKNLNNYPVNYIKNEKSLGPGLSRLKGFKASKGKYIIFMDDDDFYFANDFIEKAILKMENTPSLSFVSFNTFVYYEDKNEILINKLNVNGYLKGKDYFINFINKFQKPTSTFPTIFNKEKLIHADFNNMAMMNDASIYLRALTQGDAFIFDDFIGIYRVHSNNISKNVPLDFILSNINEKNNIYKIAKEKFNTDLKTWFKNQIFDTFRYYIIDSNCSINQAFKVINFTTKNTDISFVNMYYCFFKSILIKTILSK